MKEKIFIWIKKCSVKIIISIVMVFVVGFGFYWFEWRPAKIKHDCSWVRKVAPAEPAQPAITEEDAKKSLQDCYSWLKKMKYDDQSLCEVGIKNERPEIPAQPERTWYEPANKNTYDFCIHEKGL